MYFGVDPIPTWIISFSFIFPWSLVESIVIYHDATRERRID